MAALKALGRTSLLSLHCPLHTSQELPFSSRPRCVSGGMAGFKWVLFIGEKAGFPCGSGCLAAAVTGRFWFVTKRGRLYCFRRITAERIGHLDGEGGHRDSCRRRGRECCPPTGSTRD